MFYNLFDLLLTDKNWKTVIQRQCAIFFMGSLCYLLVYIYSQRNGHTCSTLNIWLPYVFAIDVIIQASRDRINHNKSAYFYQSSKIQLTH